MTALSKLFERRSDADTISDYPMWRIGLSCAASWSWGVSIAVGIAILHSRGVIPCVAWMIGNALALPLFGFVRTYLPKSKYWVTFTPFFLLLVFVDYFALTFNLQAIKNVLQGGINIESYQFVGSETALWLTIPIGLFFLWFINRRGLRGSVLTDLWQYIVQFGGVILLAIIGFMQDQPADLPELTLENKKWMMYGFLGIITGALATGHQWQRFMSIPQSDAFRVGIWGGFFFGIYMAFVFVAGLYYHVDLTLGIVLLIIVLSVATSTIDSAIAGLQFAAGRLGLSPIVGSFVAFLALLVWPYYQKMGLADLWSVMGALRWPVVVAMLLGTLAFPFVCHNGIKDERLHLLRRLGLVFGRA